MDVTTGMMATNIMAGMERHQILAENVANNNTPRYHAKELVIPNSFQQIFDVMYGLGNQLQVNVTSAMHQMPLKKAGRFKIGQDRNAKNFKPNDNNVDIGQQAQKIGINKTLLDAAIQAYTTTNSLHKIALGGNEGE